MINIDIYGKDKVVIHGHSYPDICAACSSIMYTTVNVIDKYDSSAEEFIDDTVNDIVTIIIKRHDNIIDMILDNMFDMFNDLYEDNKEYIEIKKHTEL